jgi:ribose 5-phosphate isomerase B
VNIAIGSDHRGLDFKKYVTGLIAGMGFSYQDFGSYTSESVDYPDIARAVSEAVAKGEFDFGILICGTGLGMSMAANKVKGIRGALCSDTFCAQRARSHNNANVLCLGAERGESGVKDILEVFFKTPFEGGRHQRRLDKMEKMEEGGC